VATGAAIVFNFAQDPAKLAVSDVALASDQSIRRGAVRRLKVSTSRSLRNPRHLRLISSAPDELRHESLITNHESLQVT